MRALEAGLLQQSEARRAAVQQSMQSSGAKEDVGASESKDSEEASESKEETSSDGPSVEIAVSLDEGALPPLYEAKGFNRTLVSKRIAARAQFLIRTVMPACP